MKHSIILLPQKGIIIKQLYLN